MAELRTDVRDEMKKFLYLMLFAVLAVSVCLNVGMYRHISGEVATGDTIHTSDTVYVAVHDTLPSMVDEKVTGSVVIHLPRYNAAQPDSVPTEPLPCQADSIVLPIVQRRYSDDSTYTAYVSGARIDSFPRLDSIIVRQRTVTNTVTITNTIREKHRHWHFGVQAGYGYGLASKQLEPYIGAGFSITVF